MLDVIHCALRLQADPARVVVRPFQIPITSGIDGRPGRVRRIVDSVLAMDDAQAEVELELVLRDFEARHWQTRGVFLTRYAAIANGLGLAAEGPIAELKQQLIGAYFCHEYSYAAAALMNPSIVPSPDQSGLTEGANRIIMSLRAVGEGHISSVAFREGILGPGPTFELMAEPPFATSADSAIPLPGDGVRVHRHRDSSLSGTVLFPLTDAQRNGLEDMRLVQFTHDDGAVEWIGTYTAYNGAAIRSEMLRTRDFREFDLFPMTGPASRNKGMALFPRKVGGQYAMIGRQDGENVFLIRSDTLTDWGEGELLLAPAEPWEMVQMGNCGSPIEVDEGWLLLTHGVGAMRKYSIGAALLDRDDPSRVLARLTQPLIAPEDADREGYVPNVVYSCGAVRHGNLLFLPYGVADSSVAFAFVPISELIAAMRRS